jgi:hypothetical protein
VRKHWTAAKFWGHFIPWLVANFLKTRALQECIGHPSTALIEGDQNTYSRYIRSIQISACSSSP